MTELISMMKAPGFSWPTCPEGGIGKPGHEEYEGCPEGWQVAESYTGRDHDRGVPDLCKKKANCNRSEGWHERGSEFSCPEFVTMRRPLRSKPYYFDIPNSVTGTTQRHWFNLNY